MVGPRIEEDRLQGISKVAKLLTSHIPQQEMDRLKKGVWDVVGGHGTGFDINHYGLAAAKIWSLLRMAGDFERRFSGRPGHNELRQTIAAALLSQMAHEEFGTFGAAHFQSFAGPRSKPLKTMSNPEYLRDANTLISRFITPADLQFYLCDYENGQDKAVIKTSAPCEDKLDYIMSLYAGMRHDAKGEFIQSAYDERQKVLVRAAVGQLKYMKDVEHREDSEVYKLYASKLAEKFGVEKEKFAGFVSNRHMMEWYLGQYRFGRRA